MNEPAPSERPLCELYVLLAEFGVSTGAGRLKDVPGCWEHAIGRHWWVAANAHGQPIDCSKAYEVAPFHFVIFHNLSTFPTAVVGPYEGLIIGVQDTQAIEDELIAAVKAASRDEKGH